MAAPAAAMAAPADGFCNVYVSSLPNTFTSGDLYKMFAPHGHLVSARCMLPKDKSATAPHCTIPNSDEHRGYGFVCFRDSADAARAVQAMAGASVDGVRIQVRPSRRDVPPATVGWEGGSPGAVLQVGSPWQSSTASPLAAPAVTFTPTSISSPSASITQRPHGMSASMSLSSASLHQPFFMGSSIATPAPTTFCPTSSPSVISSQAVFPSPLLGAPATPLIAQYPPVESAPTPPLSQPSPLVPMIGAFGALQHAVPSPPLYYFSSSGCPTVPSCHQSSLPVGGVGEVPMMHQPQLHTSVPPMAAFAPPFVDSRIAMPPNPTAVPVTSSLQQFPFHSFSHIY